VVNARASPHETLSPSPPQSHFPSLSLQAEDERPPAGRAARSSRQRGAAGGGGRGRVVRHRAGRELSSRFAGLELFVNGTAPGPRHDPNAHPLPSHPHPLLPLLSFSFCPSLPLCLTPPFPLSLAPSLSRNPAFPLSGSSAHYPLPSSQLCPFFLHAPFYLSIYLSLSHTPMQPAAPPRDSPPPLEWRHGAPLPTTTSGATVRRAPHLWSDDGAAPHLRGRPALTSLSRASVVGERGRERESEKGGPKRRKGCEGGGD
jgi:hypothetical protein